MIKTLVKFIMIAAVLGAVYFLMTNHIIFFGKTPKLLKKSEISFNNTFVNAKFDSYFTPEDMLRIEALRNDGVGDLLVEMGALSYEELAKIEYRIDSGVPRSPSGFIDTDNLKKK